MIRVGITGGIGSGKSTCCRLFAERGAAVYDCDCAAKRLMQEDPALRQALAARFGAEVYTEEGALNRSYLAGIVFGDGAALADLNGMVHPAVKADFARWCGEHAGEDYVVLESAILFESGFDTAVDRTVAVTAPERLRIERTCSRDGASPEAVRARMAAQWPDDRLVERADYCVVNISMEELAADVDRLDKLFRHEAACRL